MNMKEFYEKYNLNNYYFASIAGVGAKTLAKFAEGKPIREESRLRIEKAMRVAEKYELVRPKFDFSHGFDRWYKSKFTIQVIDYEQKFEALLKKEEL